jgi:hypothetical protein
MGGLKMGKKIVPRKEVRWFAQFMEARLRANDHKGGWLDCPIESLLPRIYDEYRELLNAVTGKPIHQVPDDIQAIIDECADVANFAMMVADLVHHYGVQAGAQSIVTMATNTSRPGVIDTRFCESRTLSEG